MQKAVILAFLPGLLFLAGCNGSEKADPETRQSIAAGETLFIAHCAGCHPRSGRGDYLEKIPATLLTRRSQAELAAWIQGSDKHRDMPDFTSLTDEEKHNLAAYLHDQVTTK